MNIKNRISKNRRKNEHKKLIKLVSEQENLIDCLHEYYLRTRHLTKEVEEEMFPNCEPYYFEKVDEYVNPLFLCFETFNIVKENFDSLSVDQIKFGLSPKQPKTTHPWFN